MGGVQVRINYQELFRAIKYSTIGRIRAGATREEIEKHKQDMLSRWKHPSLQTYINSIDYDKIKEYLSNEKRK